MEETIKALELILNERKRQDEKWGEQNHPDLYTDPSTVATADEHAWLLGVPTARLARKHCDVAFHEGRPNWAMILIEEVAEVIEAAANGVDKDIDEELIQVAAVAVSWYEARQRRKSGD